MIGSGAALALVLTIITLNRSTGHGASGSGADLPAERAGFPTHLTAHRKSPQPYEPIAPPTGVHAITYPSAGYDLKAWLSDNPNDGVRHPAVVFLHGGFSFGQDDWDDQAALYAKRGFVVMTPMLRGENGNPGDFELWYGEVDDAIAAGEFIRQLSYVDPARLFVAGHSVGGTLAMLVAEVDSPFAAAASFSGFPNRFEWMKISKASEIVPFDRNDTREIRLRSPFHFAASLRCSLYIYYGSEEAWCRKESRSFSDEANRVGKMVSLKETAGDHMTSVPAAIADSISHFQAAAPRRGDK